MHGKRRFIGVVTSIASNPGAKHPYAVATDPQTGNIYATFQHTDTVLRFQKDTFAPLSYPPSMQAAHRTGKKPFNGTFLQFGEPEDHNVNEQGIRGIAIIDSNAWIANEDMDTVHIVDLQTGMTVRKLSIKKPINIYHSLDWGLVFIGSKSTKSRGILFVLSYIKDG